MKRTCPACQREFDEAGFCPFDGTALREPDVSKPTVLSAFVDAQMPPADTKLPTEPDLRRDQDPTNRVRAISAAAATQDALDSMRKRTEYDSLVGDTLDGRYFIKAKIGEGGMGVVFAARHAVIERPLAIKVLKREVMRDTATIRRFVQEAKAASRIGHPNIVDVTDFGTTPEGMTYSVMEFVDGTTLAKAIKHGAPFPAERAIRIASQIARALGAAHDKGIVHRDLKPENVFLIDREGRTDFVKIVDFGIAKVTPLDGQSDGPRLTRVGSVFGTPEYMAPEQAAGRSDTDGRVDIYALGTILYEMLCGRVPHKSDSMVRTIAMQMLDEIPLLSGAHPEIEIAPELEDVVMRALAKKREDRYQTMAELLSALERVYDSITAPPTREELLKSLPPLPPGADPIPLATDGLATAATAAPTVRRIRHEPQFVTSDRPIAFDHLLADQSQPVRRGRWPIALAVLVVAGGGAVAAILLMRGHGDTVAIVERDAALAQRRRARPRRRARWFARRARRRRRDRAAACARRRPGRHRHAEPSRHDRRPGVHEARHRADLRRRALARRERHPRRRAVRDTARDRVSPTGLPGRLGRRGVRRPAGEGPVRARADQALRARDQEPVRRLPTRLARTGWADPRLLSARGLARAA